MYLHLRREYGDVSYWRGKREVDFVVRLGDRVIPIQLTWDQAKERHEEALEEFYENFPFADEAVFVTRENFRDVLEFGAG